MLTIKEIEELQALKDKASEEMIYEMESNGEVFREMELNNMRWKNSPIKVYSAALHKSASALLEMAKKYQQLMDSLDEECKHLFWNSNGY